ncbi:MAG: late competence development ComFB family protein [Pseudanabaenaceae cyanobacterium SKYGB_i_bin29]|nr:late competence development ComFB family protein [Pseudanabaenaceae cyanobacterium SKYG29]MDW8421087.1 late competence development ComFB family protein [Pseudanabaenaceae cyanobacterium SKYGB_i_bin29]
MESCRNVMLPLVYAEARQQLQRAGTKSNIAIADVVAYSLNRLSPLFIARQDEWQKQIPLLQNTLRGRISEVVHQAILQVRKPRLQSVTPLTATELATPMYTLLRLRELLKKPQMTWLELPQCLEEYLLQINPQSGSIPINKYVSKRKEDTSLIPSKADYDDYTLPATIGVVNSIEQLIYRLAVHRLDTLPPKLSAYARLIPVDEVMAVALNCLPPMYATTQEGLKRLRYYSKIHIGSQLAEIVTKAVITLGQEASKSFSIPILIFQNIRQERQEAMARLNWMLKRKDINWENSYAVILEAIDRLRLTGNLDWQRIKAVEENS